MLLRLRDFAEMNRIAERTVQAHIKENWETLKDHVDRRGKQGTWLDDYACDFLIASIQLPSGKEELVPPSPKEAALMVELNDALRMAAAAERRAAENAEAAGKVKLLEASTEDQASQISKLTFQVGSLTQKLAQADEEGRRATQKAVDALRTDLEEKHVLELAEAHQEASDANQRADELRRASDEREAKWREYSAAMQAYTAMSRWQRRKVAMPIPPIED